MFFNEFLANDEILGPVWRAGNSFSDEANETTSLPIICRNLDQLMSSESINVRRRLSLRTSVVLIDGAAKLYRKEMEQLVKDVAKLDEEMVFRNRRDPTNIEEDASITSSGSLVTPEQMMRRAEIIPDVSFEAPTRNPTISPPTIRRDYSFITSTPSPSKRKKTELIGNASKRSTNSDSSKESLYPYSVSNDSDEYTEKTPSSSDLQTDYHNEKKSDMTTEKAESNQSNRSLSEKSKKSDQSSQKRAQKSSDRVLSKSDQQTAVRNSDEQNVGWSSDEMHFEINRPLQKIGERSHSSPTFTEIMNTEASQPNIGEKETRETHQNNTRNDTNNAESVISSDRRNAEKGSDVRIDIERDQTSQGNRSIILQTTKKSQPRLRRKRKATRHKIMKDQATQCVSFCPRTDERDNNTFDKSLPFAYLLIHDSYQSIFPSKIVISSLKEDVNKI